MTIAMILLAMQMFVGNDEGCKVHYKLMESETWFLLDDSGIDDHHTEGVRYGEGESA